MSVPAKSLEALVEVDVGLWAGLTETQLKNRFPSAHRSRWSGVEEGRPGVHQRKAGPALGGPRVLMQERIDLGK